MLMDYKGSVTVKVDGLAASAASVIAMAGTKVLMSPVSMMMIHNPITIAMGDAEEMEKAKEMLAEVKEFKSGTLSLGVDDIGAQAAGDLTGTVIDANGVVISTSEDGGEPVAVGFRAKMSNGL